MRSYFLAWMVVLTSAAGPVVFESGPGPVSLLELYTSEGCSSCPPAEKWLSKLKESPTLWKEIVPVAFHVNYWDSLGWKDRYGSEDYSDRQRAYSASFKRDSVYTPEFVLNGSEWRSWFGLRRLPGVQKPSGDSVKASSDDGQNWTVHFESAREKGPLEAHVALLGCGLHTQVLSGENQGKVLEHDFVVLAFKTVPLTRRNGEFEATIKLKNEMTPERGGRPAVAVWVTKFDGWTPLQATGGWLP